MLRRRPRSFRMVLRITVRAAGVALAYILLTTGAQPYVQAHRLGDQAQQLAEQVQAAQQQQSDLRAQVAELRTTRGQENAARVYGWVLKGEVPISCPTPDTALSRMSDAELLSRPEQPVPPLWRRLRQALEW